MSISGSPKFRIEQLGRQHDRQNFNCGIDSLDRYFHNQAGQDLRNKVAVTFLLLKEDIIAGYYTLSNTSILLSEFPAAVQKRLPKYPVIPDTLIGRLARDMQFRAEGIGEILLIDALKRSLLLSHQIASFATVVEAENTYALQFYLNYKFIQFASRTNHLYLPMSSIEKLYS